jgi:Lysyl oxidase
MRPGAGALTVQGVWGWHMGRRAIGYWLAAGALLAGSATVSGDGAISAVGRSPAAALYPDVIEEVPHHLQIQNTQQREFLRFSTTHINIGDGNLQIRGGGQVAPCTIDGISYEQCTVATQELLDARGDIVATQPAGVALFHPEHNHWHQSAVAEFAVRASLNGPPISSGTKITFCFVDVEFVGRTGADKKAHPRTYFECNGDLQGLASQWADSYHQSTPLQELEITDLDEGTYYLTHLADPDNHWAESNEANNFTWVQFELSRKGANPEVRVIDQSPCEPAVICGFGGNP